MMLLGGCLVWFRCLCIVAVENSEDGNVRGREASTRLSVEKWNQVLCTSQPDRVETILLFDWVQKDRIVESIVNLQQLQHLCSCFLPILQVFDTFRKSTPLFVF